MSVDTTKVASTNASEPATVKKGQKRAGAVASWADERLGLSTDQLASLVAEPITFTGAAVAQTQAVVRAVEALAAQHPAAAAYAPGAIL